MSSINQAGGNREFAVLRAIESSLTSDDVCNMLLDFKPCVSIETDFFIEAIDEFISKMNEKLERNRLSEEDKAWANQMSSAASLTKLMTGIIKQEHTGTVAKNMFATIIGLSIMVTSASSLAYILKNGVAIANNPLFPFPVSGRLLGTTSMYITALFSFWLSYDQLHAKSSSRAVLSDAYGAALEELMPTRLLLFLWTKLLLENKFSSKLRYIQYSDRLMVKEDITEEGSNIKTEKVIQYINDMDRNIEYSRRAAFATLRSSG